MKKKDSQPKPFKLVKLEKAPDMLDIYKRLNGRCFSVHNLSESDKKYKYSTMEIQGNIYTNTIILGKIRLSFTKSDNNIVLTVLYEKSYLKYTPAMILIINKDFGKKCKPVQLFPDAYAKVIEYLIDCENANRDDIKYPSEIFEYNKVINRIFKDWNIKKNLTKTLKEG